MKKKIMIEMVFCMLLLVGSTGVFAIQFGNDSFTVPNWGGSHTGTVYVQCDGDATKKASFNVTYSATTLSKSVALSKGNTQVSDWASAPAHKWVYFKHTETVASGSSYNSKAKSNNLEPTSNTKITY